MKIGITGSSGFIGKHLVDALGKKKNINLSHFDLPKYDLLNPDSLKSFVKNKNIIVHTAAVNRGTDKEIIAGSVVATYNLISAMEKFNNKTKLIYLSSIQAETNTVYGLSKKLTEIMLEDFSQEYKTPVTIFRLTNVFGEDCCPFYNSVVATFCHQVTNNKKIIIKNGDKKINFIYVNDVIKKIVKEIFAKRKKIFYFKKVDSKNTITIKNLAHLIKSFKNLKNPKKLKSKFYRDLYKTYLSYQ